MDNEEVDFINEKIKVYGSNIYGDPLFRVVFSNDQKETRKGTFNEYSGNTFVRTICGVREGPKYPWIKDKWIIERWVPGDAAYHPSLVTIKNGVYVCVYVFQDKDFNYLPPLLKVAEIVIHALLHPRSSSQIKAEDEVQLKKEEDQEVDKILLKIQIESDESKTKDPKAQRESMSSGYTKSLIEETQ